MTSNMTAQNVVGSSSRTHIETAHIVGAEEKWRAFRICFSENQRLLSTLVISSLLYYVRWNDVCGPDAFIIASLSPSGRCWKTGGREGRACWVLIIIILVSFLMLSGSWRYENKTERLYTHISSGFSSARSVCVCWTRPANGCTHNISKFPFGEFRILPRPGGCGPIRARLWGNIVQTPQQHKRDLGYWISYIENIIPQAW